MNKHDGEDDFDRDDAPNEGAAPKKAKRPVFAQTVYDVGYGKPPAAQQFQKGQSGNPSGRPKGAKNRLRVQIERLKARVKELAEGKVVVHRGDQRVRLPRKEVILQNMFAKAAKGDYRSMRYMLDLFRDIERDEKRKVEWTLDIVTSYMAKWECRLSDPNYYGPKPLPHPADIRINPDNTVDVLGPMTQQELERDREIEEKRYEWKEQLLETEQELVTAREKRSDKRYNQKQLRSRIESLERDKAILIERLRLTTKEARYARVPRRIA